MNGIPAAPAFDLLVAQAFIMGQACFFCTVLAIAAKKKWPGNLHAWSSSIFSIPLMLVALPMVWFSFLPAAYAGFLFCWSIAWVAFFGIRTARRRARNEVKGGAPMQGTLKVAGTTDDLATRNEGLRKLFHLSGFLILLAYYLVIPAIAPVVDILSPFATVEDARDAITLFTLCCGVVISMHLDTQRIFFGEEYGMRHFNAILREKEIGAPAAQTYLIVSSVAAWVVGMAFRWQIGEVAMVIPLVSIVMATFADGIAAMIGKAKGKHKVRRPFNQVKSVEGFAAGFVTALAVAFVFFLQFDGGWLLAIIMSCVFLLVDYVSLPIADNALNPIILTLVAELVACML